MPKSILVVDDDPHIREILLFALEKAGMQAHAAKDGREAIEQWQSRVPALIILDIGMPEMDGLEVCKTIRKTSEVPILFLSSHDEEIDRIVGLEIGGDDYVTKPFSPRELVARVNAILKRAQNGKPAGATSSPASLSMMRGLVELVPEMHQARWNGQVVELTATEFAILKGMLCHPGRVWTRDAIMTMAYDRNTHVSDRTIDSHIRHIRHKFAALGGVAVVETVHGVGYKLGPCD